MSVVNVRYIVHDVEAAIGFYRDRLGFTVELHPGPGFAILSRGDLRLLLNAPGGGGGAAQPTPDGRVPEPGGWNRIQIEVDDLDREVEALRSAGARFRNEIVAGRGGRQILLEDPSGNAVELFEPPGTGVTDPKAVVRRLIEEVMNGGRLDVVDELYTPELAPAARRWIAPFRESFPDVRMDIVDLIAEGEKVVGRFHCSATNLGPWRGNEPTGRRFERVDEVYVFRVAGGRIAEAWGLEDTASRERQLGLRD
jgi:catechol 2,3-dioxygenase-like lactoylglutathione lyase family enzyme/predicted ester cyclase